MWTNFHTHTNFCDGKGSFTDFLFKASEYQMLSLGFSSHAPLPFERPWSLRRERYDDYLLELHLTKEFAGRIQVYAGLEIDFLPGSQSPSKYKEDLDYTIGSVHFVDSFPDGTPWEIDNTTAVFRDGLEQIFHNDIRAALKRYYSLIRQMISTDPPTVVGHLDKIKVHNYREPFWDESEKWYREEVDETLGLIRESGAIVEVNTRGVYQKKSASVYPSPWILERACRLGIPITLSSDAHRPDDLVTEFQSTAALLFDLGFTELSVLHNGEWNRYGFDEQGIILPD